MGAAEDLQSAYDNMAARLKEITSSPKPTYTIDGQTVLWGQYQRLLLDGMKKVREELDDAGPDTFYTEETIAYVDPPYGAGGL